MSEYAFYSHTSFLVYKKMQTYFTQAFNLKEKESITTLFCDTDQGERMPGYSLINILLTVENDEII